MVEVAEVVAGTHAAWMVSERVAVVKVKEKECKAVCDGLVACGPRGSYVPVGVYGWPAEL